VIKFTNKKVLVTCALPYINNVPHLGNLIPILSADIYTRFLKKKGFNAIYICATDEHGTRTEIEAKKQKISSEKYSKNLNTEILRIFKWFNINFDNFGRTSCKENHEITKDIFLKLYKKNYIIEREIVQLYCSKCKQFLADTYIHGICPYCKSEHAKGDQCDSCSKLLSPQELINPHCKICSTTPESRTTKHFFLDLPKLAPKIKKWISTKKNWKGVAKTLPLAWLKAGLQERCITRDLKFGVKVPLKGYENKVFYVWFDAPNGYVASTAEWAKKHKKNWKKYWFGKDVHYVQFMGKDNVPFHTLIWPGALLGTEDNWHLVDYLCSNEYLNWEGGQFSKSQKRGVFTSDAINLGFAPDFWRFYLSINRPGLKDSDFSWNDFIDRINNELIANIGNLVYRTLSFTKRNFGKVPKANLGVREKTLIKKVEQIAKKADKELFEFEFKKSIKLTLSIGNLANQYFQSQKPWETIKTDKKKCATTLFTCSKIIALLAEQLEPFTPETAKKIKEQLKLKKVEILFKKLDPEEINKLKQKFSGKEEMKVKKMIKFQDFEKLDLRVGKIVSVTDHPKADRLYKMKVDFGAETRQVLAGIKQYYKPADLKNKQAVFIINLEPREIRGEKSEAMILAAEQGNKVVFISPEKNIKEGSQIH